jgi:hypothetical protein
MNNIQLGKLYQFNYGVWPLPYGWNTIDEANICHSVNGCYRLFEDLCLVLECKSFNSKSIDDYFAVKVLTETGNIYWICVNQDALVLAAKE